MRHTHVIREGESYLQFLKTPHQTPSPSFFRN
jgi:hypothetical protein